MNDRPTRRELMRPIQLLAIAFACAIFAGGVTLITTGFFVETVGARAVPLAAIVTGITFIVVLLGLALMLLAVNPRDLEQKTLDRPVLYPASDSDPSGAGAGADAGDATDASGTTGAGGAADAQSTAADD